MPVNRTLFTEPLTETRAPNWHCPRCNGGHLRLVQGSLHKEFSGDTKQASQDEDFDFDWVVTRFTALVKCDNEDCQETASVAGRGEVIDVPNWNAQSIEYEDRFIPTYVNPSPPIIQVPDRCPQAVIDELKRAAVAQWDDSLSAASHIRSAVERLLDAQKILKTAMGKHGRVRLSLHDRIVLFEKARADQGKALRATKWLGNAGIHSGELERKDIFDMFDIVEKVLYDLYAGHAKSLTKLIDAVNKAKGPV